MANITTSPQLQRILQPLESKAEGKKNKEEEREHGVIYDDQYDYLQHMKTRDEFLSDNVWEVQERPSRAKTVVPEMYQELALLQEILDSINRHGSVGLASLPTAALIAQLSCFERSRQDALLELLRDIQRDVDADYALFDKVHDLQLTTKEAVDQALLKSEKFRRAQAAQAAKAASEAHTFTLEASAPEVKPVRHPISNVKLPDVVFASKDQEEVGLLNKAAKTSGSLLDWDPDIVETLDDEFKHETVYTLQDEDMEGDENDEFGLDAILNQAKLERDDEDKDDSDDYSDFDSDADSDSDSDLDSDSDSDFDSDVAAAAG